MIGPDGVAKAEDMLHDWPSTLRRTSEGRRFSFSVTARSNVMMMMIIIIIIIVIIIIIIIIITTIIIIVIIKLSNENMSTCWCSNVNF